jgi:hypothetical protein
VIAVSSTTWEFFGGMFPVLIPDNLKPVVDAADRLEPRWNREWLEYAQARGLAVDPARVRSPQDKGRVESGVKFTQRSFFAGEQFLDIADAQRRADDWCRARAGMRVHGTTRRRPAEAFAEHELPLLLAAPEEPYRVPAWSDARVQRDFRVRAQNAFYSVPYGLIGQQVTVRADDALVKVTTGARPTRIQALPHHAGASQLIHHRMAAHIIRGVAHIITREIHMFGHAFNRDPATVERHLSGGPPTRRTGRLADISAARYSVAKKCRETGLGYANQADLSSFTRARSTTEISKMEAWR